jgi:cysteine desulfurase/selenocysteine lyase
MRKSFVSGASLAQNDRIANELKQEFPVFENRPGLVYLDTAATAQKPYTVLEAERHYYENDCANVHRSIHTIGEDATRHFESARTAVAGYIGADSRETIFTRGTTESVNLVARTLGETFSDGDEIVLSEMEHHANIVPWQMLASRTGVKLRFVRVDDGGELDIESFNRELSTKTKLVSITMASNVLGTINPVAEIIAMAHEAGSLVHIDAAQALPRSRIDVRALDADFLSFSSHKMYGPTGIGILYGKKKILNSLPPFQGGGEMISDVSLDGFSVNELPYKFEAGTPAIAQAIGLARAAQWLDSVNPEALGGYETQLAHRFMEGLREINGVKILGSAGQRAGIVAFTMENVHSHDLAAYLDRGNIAVRAGQHCAHPLAKRFGIVSSVRASFGAYSLITDVDKTISLLQQAQREL